MIAANFEAISWIQIDFCDPASTLPATFDTSFPLPEGKNYSKMEHVSVTLNSDISDIKHNVTKQLKGIPLQDFQHTFLHKVFQLCADLCG